VAAGAAIYRNFQEGSVKQVRLSLERDGLDGWVGYSYRTTDADVNAGTRTQPRSCRAHRQLTAPGAPFATPAGWARRPTSA
jgi:hypothetical protein